MNKSSKKRGAKYSHEDLSIVTNFVNNNYNSIPDYSECINVAETFNSQTGQNRDPGAIYMLVWRINNGVYSSKYPDVALSY